MVPTTKSREFRAGSFLFNEGEPSDSMFLIQKGTVSIRKRKGSGYIEIARIFPNEVIGELSFFDRSPRSAAAVALTEVSALEIDFKAVDKIYSKIPSYFQTIMACIADRLKKADERIQRLQRHLVDDNITPTKNPMRFQNAEDVVSMAGKVDEEQIKEITDAQEDDSDDGDAEESKEEE